jgi:hypothetical protein
MDAQLVISHIRQIRVTRVHGRLHERHGVEKFVRIITVRYADDSEYEICLGANDAAALEFIEAEPPERP